MFTYTYDERQTSHKTFLEQRLMLFHLVLHSIQTYTSIIYDFSPSIELRCPYDQIVQ